MNERMKLIQKTWKSLRFLQLLVFTLIVLIARASWHHTVFLDVLFSLLYFNVMRVTISATVIDKRKSHLDEILTFLWLATILFKHFFTFKEGLVSAIDELLAISLFAICVFNISKYILTSKKVTEDTLFAAVMNYILIVMLFAQVYEGVDGIVANGFSYLNQSINIDDVNILTSSIFTYFSFVTITTLGYGDMIPTHPITQILAAIEAVVGQFYVAIIVSWLVSRYVLHSQPKE
jgi:hypothetical protein